MWCACNWRAPRWMVRGTLRYVVLILAPFVSCLVFPFGTTTSTVVTAVVHAGTCLKPKSQRPNDATHRHDLNCSHGLPLRWVRAYVQHSIFFTKITCSLFECYIIYVPFSENYRYDSGDRRQQQQWRMSEPSAPAFFGSLGKQNIYRIRIKSNLFWRTYCLVGFSQIFMFMVGRDVAKRCENHVCHSCEHQ